MKEEIYTSNKSLSIKKNQQVWLSNFASKALKILDDAQLGLIELFQSLDDSNKIKKQKNTNKQKNLLKSLSQSSFENQKNVFEEDKQSENVQDYCKSIKHCQLVKKKSQLMKKIIQVDQSFIKSKQKLQKSNKKIKIQEKKPSNSEKITKKLQKLDPLKIKIKIINQNHSFDMIDQMNRQKIIRQQEIIKRIKLREKQEIVKIEQLQKRIAKNQLKRHQFIMQNKENLKAFINQNKNLSQL